MALEISLTVWIIIAVAAFIILGAGLYVFIFFNITLCIF